MRPTLKTTWLTLACLFALTSASRAEEPGTPCVVSTPAIAEPMADAGWDLYVATGPVFPFGGGLLTDQLDSGWHVEAGLRCATGVTPVPHSPMHPIVLFADVGASYTDYDMEGDPFVTGGTFYAPPDNHVHALDEFFVTELDEMRRAAIHAAIGGAYFPSMPDGSTQVRVHFRAGARLGYVDTDIKNTPTDDLNGIAEFHLSPFHVPLHSIKTAQFDPDLQIRDISWGFFGSAGVGVTFPETGISVNAEIEAEWSRFGRAGDERRHLGLGTFTPMVSVSVAY